MKGDGMAVKLELAPLTKCSLKELQQVNARKVKKTAGFLCQMTGGKIKIEPYRADGSRVRMPNHDLNLME